MPRAGETGGGAAERGRSSGNSSPIRAISLAQAIRNVSCERGFALVPHDRARSGRFRRSRTRYSPRRACRRRQQPAASLTMSNRWHDDGEGCRAGVDGHHAGRVHPAIGLPPSYRLHYQSCTAWRMASRLREEIARPYAPG
jgi:hypothetical protein